MACAGKSSWQHSKQGDSIKAAKTLQHPHMQSQPAAQASNSLGQIPSQSALSAWRGDIGIMDSVLSLEGSPAAEREWGQRIKGKHVPHTNAELYLKKGLGVSSSQHKSHLNLSR